jgi:hypothetical protein
VGPVSEDFQLPNAARMLEDLYAAEATKQLERAVRALHGAGDEGRSRGALNQALGGWGALHGHPNLENVYRTLEKQGALPDILLLASESFSPRGISRAGANHLLYYGNQVDREGPFRGTYDPVRELALLYVRRNFDAISQSGDSFFTRIGLNPWRDRTMIDSYDIQSHQNQERQRQERMQRQSPSN